LTKLHENVPRLTIADSQSASFGAVLAGTVMLMSRCGFLQVTHAVTITATAVNLADTTPGEDLWQYQYSVSDVSLSAGQGFSIAFDFTLYGNLQSPPTTANIGWNLLSIQPDPPGESDGHFNAQATGASPSLANPFTLTFVWMGIGTPGPQPFTVFDSSHFPLVVGVTAPTNPPSPPTINLKAMPMADTFELAWVPSTGVLEVSTDLTTWTTIPNAVSPLIFVLDGPGGSRYYRLRTGR
jgi:hypothetical protein